jgi:hypothetical protein
VLELRSLWKWLTFVVELLCLFAFTNAAYLAPIPNKRTLVILLLSTFAGAMIFAWSSGREFQRSGRSAVKGNPPVIIFLIAVAIHAIVALLKFVIFP